MIEGKTVVASISGGKDSAAMALHFVEQEIPHRRVFMDTGWEAQETYDYISGPLTDAIGEIETVSRPEGGMVDLVRKKQMFPSRLIRFCTQELKVRPIQDYLLELQADGLETVNAVGIRHGESKARSKMVEWEENETLGLVWRPILKWSEQDVVDIHKRHGLRPNPLYLRGSSRVGCWPCIFARKQEIRVMADSDPARVNLIADLEHELGRAAEERAKAKGKTAKRPTWFHTHEQKTRPLPIIDAVEWSRTARGGRQFELFAPPENELGCMRWGLCEADDPQGQGWPVTEGQDTGVDP